MRQTDSEPFLTLVSLGNQFRNKAEKPIEPPPPKPQKKKKILKKEGTIGYCLL